MAIIYVDSNASGLNDGTSWTDAYADVTLVGTPAVGDVIYLASDHAGSITGNTILSWSNADAVLSVNSTTNAAEEGAIVTSTSGYLVLKIFFMYGIRWKVNNNQIQFPHTIFGTADSCIFEDGYIHAYFSGRFLNCTADQAGLSTFARWRPGSASLIFIRICNLTIIQASTTNIGFFDCNGRPIVGEIIDSDLLTWSTSIITKSTKESRFTLSRCVIESLTKVVDSDVVSTTVSQEILVENCSTGTITVPPLGVAKHWAPMGKVSTTLSQYRTNGADDGEQANAYSWEMISSSSAIEVYNALETPVITRWVDGGTSITVTIYLAGGATLNDDDFWIEISSPDETASPNQTAQGNYYSSRAAPLATPVALTTDSVSTWNGTGVGTKQKISRTFTPTEAGPVTVRCFLAKPSTTVYVDPKLEVA